jgi:hypothetical protein
VKAGLFARVRTAYEKFDVPDMTKPYGSQTVFVPLDQSGGFQVQLPCRGSRYVDGAIGLVKLGTGQHAGGAGVSQ